MSWGGLRDGRVVRPHTDASQLLIVLPTLNEGQRVVALLSKLQVARSAGAQVVLVDGGSRDDTCALAAGLVDAVLTSAPGRGEQIGVGIASSTRECIWMLHADSTLTEQHYLDVLAAFARGAVWGRFNVVIERDSSALRSGGWLHAESWRGGALRCIAFMMNLRTRATGIVTGDHGIFCLRSALQQAGGFPRQPLMEDIELSRRLRSTAWPVALTVVLGTSGRRWEKRGVFTTVLLMWTYRLRYFFGASPAELAREYYRE